jgi:hypothetical protein
MPDDTTSGGGYANRRPSPIGARPLRLLRRGAMAAGLIAFGLLVL